MLEDTVETTAVARDVGGCPVKSFTVFADQPAGQYWSEADALREEAPAFWNAHAQGYWVVTRFDAVRDMYQSVDKFSSESFTAWDPNPPYRFVPTQIEPTGQCDFVSEFAIRFPTEVFLVVIGLPPEDADQLVPWVEDFFLGLNGAEAKQPGMVAALQGIRNYFVDVLAARREKPLDPDDDLISHLLAATVDGEPLSDAVLLDMCTVLQSLRMHSIIIADSRKATHDFDFYGCPVKQGDMVMGLVSAANTDPRHYAEPDVFKLDRKGAHHLGFAGGPHRCLGAHLARREMLIAAEEWHRAIPHYRIAGDGALLERGGQLALLSLPLVWDTSTDKPGGSA